MRRAAHWALALAIPALVAGVAVAGLLEALADPVVRRTAVELQDWPAGAAPITVALVSDIHIGNIAMDTARLDRIVGQIEVAKPDLIVLAGDFVVGHDPSGIEARAALLTAPLTRLKAPLGTVAVLGNHDYWTGAGRVSGALKAAGVTVLDNEASRRGPILLVGVSDTFSGHDDIARALAQAKAIGGPAVVLSHSPDVVPGLPPAVHLVLAGHTHCGQVVLPLIGALPGLSLHEHARRLFDPRYRCGVIRDPGRTVIITGGVGSGTLPLRIGAPPDFWLVTLRGTDGPSWHDPSTP